MAITVYSGRPGTGKTYAAVRTLKKDYLDKGHDVYSNIKLNYDLGDNAGNIYYWGSLDDFVNITGDRDSKTVIFMDEIHMYLGSRNWKKLPRSVIWKLSQHRKFGLDILATVQNIKRIDTAFRELIHYWWECELYFNKIIVMDEWDIDLDFPDKSDSKPLRSYPIILDEKGFSAYDSYQPVKSLDDYEN